METNLFDLTPEQKGLLVALAQKTGKPIPALIAEALGELQEHVHLHGERAQHPTLPPDQMTKPLWEIADDLLKDVPQEVLDRLPTDGAAQHDHYIYGTPKRLA
jgi:hypothetical protein